jgi:hypothetical protein
MAGDYAAAARMADEKKAGSPAISRNITINKSSPLNIAFLHAALAG